MITQTLFRQPLHLGGKEIFSYLSISIVICIASTIGKQEALRSFPVRGKKNRAIVWKIKNATGRFVEQLYPSNLINAILYLVF